MKKKIRIFISLLLIVSVSIGLSFSFFNKRDENVDEGEETNKSGKMLAFTVNGEETDIGFPQKGEGYLGDSVVCTNGITGVWNNDLWALELSNVTTITNCTINFVEYHPYLYEKILEDNPNVSTRSDFSTAFTYKK